MWAANFKNCSKSYQKLQQLLKLQQRLSKIAVAVI